MLGVIRLQKIVKELLKGIWWRLTSASQRHGRNRSHLIVLPPVRLGLRFQVVVLVSNVVAACDVLSFLASFLGGCIMTSHDRFSKVEPRGADVTLASCDQLSKGMSLS